MANPVGSKYIKEISPKRRKLLKAHIAHPEDPIKACRMAGYNPGSKASAVAIIHRAKKDGEQTMAQELKNAKLSAEWILKGVVELATEAKRDADRLRAYELLGKHLKMFTDKVEMTGKDGNDLFNMKELSDDELNALIESAAVGGDAGAAFIAGNDSSSDTREEAEISEG